MDTDVHGVNGSMAGSQIRILVVDDDPRLGALISEYLTDQGFSVSLEADGERAVSRIFQDAPDGVILDIMLPNKDGLTVCREIRASYRGWILMLTAREDDLDQVVGLELGADDYLVKPVLPRLLLARIRNQLRRAKATPPAPPQQSARLEFGKLCLSKGMRTVVLADELITLSTNEFDLLWLLAENAGKVLSRESILQTLRGIDYDGMDRSVDVGVSRLRRKLGDDGVEPTHLKTVRGQGYLFVPLPW